VLVLLARYHVKAGHRAKVEDALTRMAAIVGTEEPGCRLYQVSRCTEPPDQLVLYEQYADGAALEEHRRTAHFRAIVEGEVLPLLEHREREVLELVIG